VGADHIVVIPVGFASDTRATPDAKFAATRADQRPFRQAT
jgi:hypothetical protein